MRGTSGEHVCFANDARALHINAVEVAHLGPVDVLAAAEIDHTLVRARGHAGHDLFRFVFVKYFKI